MNCRPVLIALGLALALPSAAIAKVAPWNEICSPHFCVLTNGSAADARHVAHEFEQMRYVFAGGLKNARLDSGEPMLIFAARDEQTAKSLEPGIWKRKGAKPAGLFKHGWEKQYVMVDLDAETTGLNTYALVYHEYTHFILHLNAHWLPVWLDEGMAEFYAYTRFQGNKILLGVPTARQPNRGEAPIPLKTLLEVTLSSPYYSDSDKVEQFYFESWVLVHYLTFGPNMGGGVKLNQFFGELQTGTEQEQAFQQVFGSLAAVEKGLDQYMMQVAFRVDVVPDESQVNEKTFTVKKLTIAETEAQLAGYHLWSHDVNSAQPLVKQALADDPKLGLAHEENGFLLFAAGNDGAATAEFSQAYTLDSSLYLSLFAKTMLSPIAASNAAVDEAAFRAALEHVADLNEQFAPAYVQMARLAMRENNPQLAFSLSRKAEELEPWRAGYHLLTGQILLRMGKDAEAASFAEFVAEHWDGPDHNEAVELWNTIPMTERPAGKSLVEEIPDNTKTARGTVQSVQCGAKTSHGRWSLAATAIRSPFIPWGSSPSDSPTLYGGEKITSAPASTLRDCGQSCAISQRRIQVTPAMRSR